MKKLSFYNMRAKWRIAVALFGLMLVILGFIIYEGYSGNWLYLVGYPFILAPLLYPFKFRDYVKNHNKLISIKIGKNKTYTIRPERVTAVEIFADKMTIFEGRKKRRPIDLSGYEQESIFKLVDLLSP